MSRHLWVIERKRPEPGSPWNAAAAWTTHTRRGARAQARRFKKSDTFGRKYRVVKYTPEEAS